MPRERRVSSAQCHAPAVTEQWAQPAAANPKPFSPPPLCRIPLLPPPSPPDQSAAAAPPAAHPCPRTTVTMSHMAEYSSCSRPLRRQEQGGSSIGAHALVYPTGKESGLPLIECPDCNLARVIELRAKKDTPNNGRTFFKCPRNGVSFCNPPLLCLAILFGVT